jgi:hypothetical protein
MESDFLRRVESRSLGFLDLRKEFSAICLILLVIVNVEGEHAKGEYVGVFAEKRDLSLFFGSERGQIGCRRRSSLGDRALGRGLVLVGLLRGR